jgi:hypothetical protein
MPCSKRVEGCVGPFVLGVGEEGGVSCWGRLTSPKVAWLIEMGWWAQKLPGWLKWADEPKSCLVDWKGLTSPKFAWLIEVGACAQSERFGDFLRLLNAAKSWWKTDPLAVIHRHLLNIGFRLECLFRIHVLWKALLLKVKNSYQRSMKFYQSFILFLYNRKCSQRQYREWVIRW